MGGRLNCAIICSEMSQPDRDDSMRRFREGHAAVLVATAVAARGLDIVGVDHVINYDLPQHIDDYVHRIGRTGRVGNPGRATAFYDPQGSNDESLCPSLLKCFTGVMQPAPDWLTEAAANTGPSNEERLTAADQEEDW